MNTTLKYLAIIAAFASAGLAFAQGATWPGVLAAAAGILVAVTVIRKEPR